MLTIAEALAQAVEYHRGGNFGQAEHLYRLILQADPNHADAHHLLGVLAYQTGRFELAAGSISHALVLSPGVGFYYHNLGLAQKSLGQADQSLTSFRESLRLQPHSPDSLNAVGNALRERGMLVEAEAYLRQALQLQPNHPEAHNNLGSALLEQGRVSEAAAHLWESLRLRPDFPEAHNNLANALLEQGSIDEALAHCREAVRLRPNFADAHNDLGLLLLLRGDFECGWPEYEWRWKLPGTTERRFDQPRWDGSPLNGRTILLHAEQGLGDTIHFIRYVPLVKERGGKVVVECQPALLRLLAGLPAIDRLMGVGTPLPAFDVHAPLLALPGIFRHFPATFPADVPYLHADAQLVEQWEKELGPPGSFKVGIAWQGNPGFPRDCHRSVPLARFGRLAQVPGVQLVNLQKGPGLEQMQFPSCQFPVVDLGNRLDESAGAFMDTAAVMQNLDLVISSDTAVAHLAGALGVPVWVALAVVPDWRWLLQREDTPWYPTMRLFRQGRVGDWEEVFERMALELTTSAKSV